jgi:transposase
MKEGVCKLNSAGKQQIMKPYSQDLRERVLRAVDTGMPRADIVKTFAVSPATIKRYLKQRRETGNLKPKAIPGRPAHKGAALDADLSAQVEAHRDARLEDHCQLWEAEHGVQVSTATMSRAIRRIGWTRKKNRWWPVNGAKRSEQPGVSKSVTSTSTSSSLSMNVAPTSR